MNFHDTAQYTRVVADLRKGPWGTPHNCGKKKQRGGQYNGNAASVSLLVYTYLSSPGKESTRPNSNPPNASFIFICFQLTACIS